MTLVKPAKIKLDDSQAVKIEQIEEKGKNEIK